MEIIPTITDQPKAELVQTKPSRLAWIIILAPIILGAVLLSLGLTYLMFHL